MIDRFQGANRPALVAAVLRQSFVENQPPFADELINAGTLIEFKPGERLIIEDDGTNDLYLLAAGTVSVVAKGVEIRVLGSGSHVGEMSAIHPANPRSATS
jgi:CRP/FNR family cyclic AMP-dependent transcriptional regulator